MPAADTRTTVHSARAAVTSETVLDAALTLFAERGYHGTALSQIAQHLGIRTPSLYNHMRSKQELLEMIVSQTLDVVLAEFAEAIAGTEDPAAQLREATRVYALRHATNRREALVVNRDTVNLPDPALTAMRERRRDHEREIRLIITRGIESGVFAVGNAGLASFAILEMSVSIARWFREDGGRTAEQVADEYARFALRLVRHRA
ncbi:TetR/AcrR family transcriptional regulator [Pseudonocardia spinosispora]|uniref:TetR/AcrR family transcriptional regulator n=1 Tax=Pseudonocardia spinosispora TaxID=103441 RepID=UPI0006891165|nr:TetR/AcrR family transcriptional regulator [Pseudonocardia spinosispora]